ncbi:phage protein [Geomicrobium sp. JCM 19055]|nr:phage protein [Geomicrobium sp. JCM 19055]
MAVTPSFMRIASSKHGLAAIDSILVVLDKYIDYKPFELVKLTHKSGGPWSQVYEEYMNNTIEDSVIEQYHDVIED